MLKIIRKFFFVWLLALFLFVPALSQAVDLGNQLIKDTGSKAGYAAATETTFAQTLGIGIAIALSLVGVIFLILMVYAGYLWMTAGGEEEQVKKAQKIITAAIIGLIITVAAYSITAYIVPAILIMAAT